MTRGDLVEQRRFPTGAVEGNAEVAGFGGIEIKAIGNLVLVAGLRLRVAKRGHSVTLAPSFVTKVIQRFHVGPVNPLFTHEWSVPDGLYNKRQPLGSAP